MHERFVKLPRYLGSLVHKSDLDVNKLHAIDVAATAYRRS
jgi:hypothetical protein